MSNVILTTGLYAKTPYYVADGCRNLYSIEELCYYVYHNAYLMDDSFVTNELIRWVQDELELPEIAREMMTIVGRADALLKLVALLSNRIGFYEEADWERLLGEIGRNNALSVDERHKCRADGYFEGGKYVLAIDEYQSLLKTVPATDVKLRAKIHHNMGVCNAMLFRYEEAAKNFEKAYETYANTESYLSMLTAMKLYMPEQKYLSYLSDHKESYEDSLLVERNLEVLKQAWENEPTKKFVDELSMTGEKDNSYYDGIGSMAEEVKAEYKSFVFRNRYL